MVSTFAARGSSARAVAVGLATAALGLVAACSLGDLTGGSSDPAPPPVVATQCGALRCVHGACNGDRCDCAAGFSGPSCDACGNDLQDKDGDGTCSPSCAVTKCPARTKCDDSSGKALCVCPTGYVLENDACVWRGGIRDPGFQNDPPAAWQLSGGATIDPKPKDPGMVDPGYASFPQQAPVGPPVGADAGAPPVACSVGTYSHAKQTIDMPTLAEGEPFALQLSRQIACDRGFGFCFGDAYQFKVGGRTVFADRSDGFGQTNFTARKACLGERAYGAGVAVDIAAPCGYQLSAVRVDRAAIVVDPTCPAPGKVVNGDFEATGGWTVSAASTATAEVAVLVGTSQSRGGRLKLVNGCDYAQLTGSISAPSTSVSKPALTFSFKGTKNKRLSVNVGGYRLADVVGSDVFDMAKICLPDWASGTVQQLAFYAQNSAASCATADASEFIVDDVKIASEPSCDAPSLVVDGGFERGTGNVRPWTTSGATAVMSTITGAPPSSHAGNGYAMLYSTDACAYASTYQTLSVPELIPGKGGPMLSFWYRTNTATSAQFYTSVGTVPATTTWTRKTLCIAPTSAARPYSVSFQVGSSGAAPCQTPYLYFDDVEMTLDPTCPEN